MENFDFTGFFTNLAFLSLFLAGVVLIILFLEIIQYFKDKNRKDDDREIIA